MFGMGYAELILLGIVAIMLFGKRLPEVARSLGGSYRELRKGLSDIQSSFDVDRTDYSSANSRLPDYRNEYDDVDEPTGAAFQPPSDDDSVDSSELNESSETSETSETSSSKD